MKQSFADEDVPDPTDFPPADAVPGLRQLDDALRCIICRELFEAPVTLNCGHCFCSLCIRQYLPEHAECPKCRHSATEIHLRVNPALEDVIKAWSLARESVLRLVKDVQERNYSSTPERSVREGDNAMGNKRKRRSASESSVDVDGQSIGGPSKTPSHRSATQGIKVVRTLSPTGHDPPVSQLVDCPICQRRLPMDAINAHLDQNCQSLGPSSFDTEAFSSNQKRKQTQEWSKVLGMGAPGKGKGKEKEKISDLSEPLPKVSYHTIKDKALRELLTEYDLPTTGDRNTLVARHERWVMLYNANLDHSQTLRKSINALQKDLKAWEQTRKTKKHVITDTAAYEKAHKPEFENLIKQARQRKIAKFTPPDTDLTPSTLQETQSPYFSNPGSDPKS